jgi:hydrogenase maturation protease
VIAHPGEPVDLIEAWRGYDAVVLVDAARTLGRAGFLRRYEYGRDRFPSGDLGTSSHAFDLLVAIELADAMGALPRKLVLYAVEGERFALGDEPSDAVLRALDTAVERVCADVQEWVPKR